MSTPSHRRSVGWLPTARFALAGMTTVTSSPSTVCTSSSRPGSLRSTRASSVSSTKRADANPSTSSRPGSSTRIVLATASTASTRETMLPLSRDHLKRTRVLDRVVDLHAIQLVLEPPIAAALRHEAVVGRVLAGDGARTQPSGRRLRRDERAASLLLDLDQPCLPHDLHARGGVRATQRDLAQGRESTWRLIDRRDVPLPHVEVDREQAIVDGQGHARQVWLLSTVACHLRDGSRTAGRRRRCARARSTRSRPSSASATWKCRNSSGECLGAPVRPMTSTDEARSRCSARSACSFHSASSSTRPC